MQKTIKTGENIGIAQQVQGKVVDVHPHPRFKGLYQFEYMSDTWMCSNYAFKETDN